MWVAVAAGLGLGAILGVLFAPESGKQLRSRMCSSCEEEIEEEVIPFPRPLTTPPDIKIYFILL